MDISIATSVQRETTFSASVQSAPPRLMMKADSVDTAFCNEESTIAMTCSVHTSSDDESEEEEEEEEDDDDDEDEEKEDCEVEGEDNEA